MNEPTERSHDASDVKDGQDVPGRMIDALTRPERREPRICILALASTVLGLGVPLVCILFLAVAPPAGRGGLHGAHGILYLGLPLLLMGAFILGMVSLVRIGFSHGARYGNGFAWLGVSSAGVALVIGMLLPALARTHSLAFRMTCGTHLAGLGKGMLIYANDYEDELPKAGARRNHWSDSLGGHGNTTGWYALRRHDAYGTNIHNSTDGSVTNSASLYLLVRFGEVAPEQFLCLDEKHVSEFKTSDWFSWTQGKKLTDVWDFGYFENERKNQTRHVSFAYRHPFGSHALTVAHEPDMAVAADRSPWLDRRADIPNRFLEFAPDAKPFNGSAEQARRGNSLAHRGEGQNVLFLDSHVSFEKRSYVGIENDNIYTAQDRDDPGQNPKGRLPVPYDAEASSPRHRRDSVLLQENGRPSP